MEENIQKYEFEKDKKKYILSTSIIGGKYIKILSILYHIADWNLIIVVAI